jgi:cyclic pyranopterin monophosphate synthase
MNLSKLNIVSNIKEPERMRDIAHKKTTLREATAQSILMAHPDTIAQLQAGTLPKGDPLPVAKVAAIQAAKNTHQIIPYCHPVPVEYVGVEFSVEPTRIITTVTVKAVYRTGVEMEALTAASVAALTMYDMMKMLDEEMTLSETVLLKKTGGKSDYHQPVASKLKAAVLVMSDSVAGGKKLDQSGRLIEQTLQDLGIVVTEYQVIPDEPEDIKRFILQHADEKNIDLIVSTGGTGVSPRDQTPEAVLPLLEKRLPGVEEAARSYGQDRMPYAMLSRSVAGVRGKTLILCLPGSQGGVKDTLEALFPALLHAFKMMWGYGHPVESKSGKTAD